MKNKRLSTVWLTPSPILKDEVLSNTQLAHDRLYKKKTAADIKQIALHKRYSIGPQLLDVNIDFCCGSVKQFTKPVNGLNDYSNALVQASQLIHLPNENLMSELKTYFNSFSPKNSA